MANQVYQDRTPVVTSSTKPLLVKGALAVALPGAGIGTTVFTVFAITNWAMLVAISPMIIEAGFVLLGLTVATVVLGLMIKLVLAPSVALLGRSAHGTVDLIERIQYTRGTLTRNKVLYTGPDYAIIEGKGGHPEIISIEHTRRNISTRIKEEPEIEAAEEYEELPAPKKTGRELLMDGTVGRALAAGLLILGWVDQELKTMKISDFFSAIIAGLPSSGKTTTVLWLIIQFVLHGYKLIVTDPHKDYRHEDGRLGLAQELAPFSARFVFPPCGINPKDNKARMAWMISELGRRQRPGYVVRDRETVIWVIDEYNSVAEELDQQFADDMAKLEREGRKFGLHVILLGHKWAKQDIVNVKIRTAASNYLVHRFNDEGQAKLLLGSNGKKALDLSPGQYYLQGLLTGMLSLVITPNTSAHDMDLVCNMAGITVVDSTAEPISDYGADTIADDISAFIPSSPGGYNRGYNATEPDRPVDITAARLQLSADLAAKIPQMLGLDAEGASQGEIIRQLWGAEPNTRAGRQAVEELRLIRAYIAQKMAATA